MDDFEHKLSVALKTSTEDLGGGVEGSDAPRIDLAGQPNRPRDRSRVLLAAAVVVLLVAAVGGTWWATAGTHDRHAPPADASCTAGDLQISRQAPTAGEAEVLAVIAVTARSACVLSEPPVLTFRGQDVPWQSQHGADWASPGLAAGATLRFALSTQLGARGAVCEGVARTSRTVEVRVAAGQPAALSFDVGEAVCGVVSFTLYGPGATTGPDCTAADVTLSRLGTPPPGDVTVFGLVGLRVARACTLMTPPTMTAQGRDLPFEATPADPTDDGSWQPRALAAGTTLRFAVEQLPVASGNVCSGPVAHADVAVSFGNSATGGVTLPVDYGACGGQLAVTTYEAATGCTAADLVVTPRDVGQGVGAVGIDVVARSACTLSVPPSVSIAGTAVPYAASATDRSDSTPWMPTSLQPADDVQFEVTFGNTAAVSCPAATLQLGVSVTVGGDALTSFTWTGSDCGVELVRITPRADVPQVSDACTAADLQVQPVADANSASVRFSSRAGVTCTLVDPPTVLVDGDLVSWRPSTDPQVGGAWTPRQVSPDNAVTLVLTHVCGATSCPATATDATVTVSVAATSVATFSWPYRGGVGVLVSTVQ